MYHRTCTKVSNAIANGNDYRAENASIGKVATIIIWGTQYLIGSVCKVFGLIPYTDLIPGCWILE